MIDHLVRYILPAAYSLLPPEMESLETSTLVLTVALHRTGMTKRRLPKGGYSRSFWLLDKGVVLRQGTTGGLAAVLDHPTGGTALRKVLGALQYPTEPVHEVLRVLMLAIEHNDVLAVACAVTALHTLAGPLAPLGDAQGAYHNYVEFWRPGREGATDWQLHYDEALNAVTQRRIL